MIRALRKDRRDMRHIVKILVFAITQLFCEDFEGLKESQNAPVGSGSTCSAWWWSGSGVTGYDDDVRGGFRGKYTLWFSRISPRETV
jgi:hypothetical protein